MIIDEDTKKNLSYKLYPSLPLLEMSFYLIIWMFGVCIACHSLYTAGQEESVQLDVILARPWWNFWSSTHFGKDTTDMEWVTWKRAFNHVGPLVAVYQILSLFCKRVFRDHRLLFTALYSVAGSIVLIGAIPTLFLLLQIVVIWVAYQTNSAKFVWLISISYIICLEMHPLKTMKDYIFANKASQYYQGPITTIILLFMNNCCVSFALDRIWNKVEREPVLTSFLMIIAYCFYIPLLFCGAQVSSKTFKESFEKPSPPLNVSFCVDILIQSIRFGLWFLVTDVSLYFMYQRAFARHPDIVNSLNLCALCGMGFFMLLFFQLKHTVWFGFSGMFARMDNVSAPPHPKCFARFHLYSDFWRNFDYGYYMFIKEYIYLPLRTFLDINKMNKLWSTAATFLFMSIWHCSMGSFIFIWAPICFLCYLCEELARYVGRNTKYQQLESYYFGQFGVRRFHALIASPLYLIGHLNMLYFLFREEIALIFVRRIFLESWPLGFPTIIFLLYCCSQVSIEFKNCHIRSQLLACKEKKKIN